MKTTSSNYNMKLNFNLFLLLFFIYSIDYNFLPLKIPTTYFILLFFLCISFINLNLKIKNKTSLFLCLILFSWSLLSFIINQNKSPDTQIIRTCILYLLIIFTYPYVLKTLFKENTLILLKTLGFIGVINAIFIFGMLISPHFQELYLSLLNEKLYLILGSKEELLKSNMSLRMVGVTGFSVYSTGFIQIFLAIFYMLYIKLVKIRKRKDFIAIILISISAMVASRASFIGLIFLFIFSIILFGIKKSVYMSISGIIIFSIFLALIDYILPNKISNFFNSWILEFFNSGVNTGSFKSNLKMYIYDYTDFSILGDSKWLSDSNGYYMHTDVGWFRIMFSIGYIGLVLWVLLMLSLTLNVKMKLNKYDIISLCCLAYVFIMMFKGAILIDSYQSIFFLITLKYISKIQNKKHNTFLSSTIKY